MKTAELYDLDFAEWAQQNADLVRAGRAWDADLENLAEEIEDLAKRKERSLYNRFVALIEHLLKWCHQPERRGSSWRCTIMDQRKHILRLLQNNPSLRPSLPEVIVEAHEHAVERVTCMIQRLRGALPRDCPFTVEQLVDEQYFPEC